MIGDRATDVELAKNLGCRAILLQEDTNMLKPKSAGGEADLPDRAGGLPYGYGTGYS